MVRMCSGAQARCGRERIKLVASAIRSVRTMGD